MKIRFLSGKREGKESEVLDAAGKRLVGSGLAEAVKPAAKKAAASPKKATDPKASDDA